MSYEGYSQLICKNGHYWSLDCYSVMDINLCPKCNMPSVWENSVDETNCESVGYFPVKPIRQDKCEHCGSILEIIYEIPTH